MHYRGKSFRYVAEYPDGRKETLLHVPDFDFNWQHKYELAKPRWLPRGLCCVRLALSITSGNPDNPDQNGQVISACNPGRKCCNGYFEVIGMPSAEGLTR